MSRLGDYIGHAARLGAIVVVGLMQGQRSDEPDEHVANERIAACLRAAADFAEPLGVPIVVEPVSHFQVGFNHTADKAAALARRVDSPAIGYMLDTIHMHIEESLTARDNPAAWLAHPALSFVRIQWLPIRRGQSGFPGRTASARRIGLRPLRVDEGLSQTGLWRGATATADFLRRHGVMD